jgi:hypothetical protein
MRQNTYGIVGLAVLLVVAIGCGGSDAANNLFTGEGGSAGSAGTATGGSAGTDAGLDSNGGTAGQAGEASVGGSSGQGGTSTGGTGGVAGSSGTGGTAGVAGSSGTGGTGGTVDAGPDYTKPPRYNDINLWLSGDNGTVIGSPTKVAGWTDQSVAHNDVVAVDLADQPVRVANGLNGLPVVRFDGQANCMRFPGQYDNGLFGGSFHYGLSAFFVVKVTSLSGWGRFLDLGTDDYGGCGHLIAFGRTGGTADFLFGVVNENSNCNSPQTSLASSGSIVLSQAALIEVIQHPLNPPNGLTAETTILKNGMLVANGQNVPVPVMLQRRVNGLGCSLAGNNGDHGHFFQGDMAEVLMYVANLSEEERIWAETYLMNKWGITP